MIIPQLKRLITEDFISQKSWIDKLIQPLNNFFEGISSALSKGLTITDNFDGEVRSFETVDFYPIKLAWTRKNRPKAVWVVDWSAKSGATPTITAAVQVQWSNASDGSLQIDKVVGITPTGTIPYIVKIIAISG